MKKIFKKIIVWILRTEAKLVLKKYKPKIVAVTGSVGKTSTKDAIYTALSSAFFVRKSKKSFNSEIGVPLTILGCQNAWSNPLSWTKNILTGLGVILLKNHYPKWLVLEVGADAPNDIEDIACWLKPDIAVLTKFATVPVHVEFFKSPEDLMNEKKKIIKYLKKDGILVLNGDDEKMQTIEVPEGVRRILFGLNDNSEIRGVGYQVVYEESKPAGITFKIDYAGKSVPVVLPGILGEHQVLPSLAAIAVSVSKDLNVVSVSQALGKKERFQPGRMNLIEGIKGTTLIDDSYNASPVAVKKAIESLASLEVGNGKKIAVLGDMLELGKYSTEEHKKIGNLVAPVCDYLITVGLRSKDIAEGALLGGLAEKNILQFESSEEAGKHLQSFIGNGDVILIKGSQSIRTEKVTEEVMLHPEDKEKLLVRQEPEWLKR
ncbi:MAG: UDP-N-acetylmuramoyl-tripeptide--D-alanyl-D-alanine ligase [Patescibacteria group bacterium]|nr:UDP-N-acetylmuramoyl-tripeptide--D-alanyl-D-alanine ligase [Patescibacteria group bacterium]